MKAFVFDDIDLRLRGLRVCAEIAVQLRALAAVAIDHSP